MEFTREECQNFFPKRSTWLANIVKAVLANGGDLSNRHNNILDLLTFQNLQMYSGALTLAKYVYCWRGNKVSLCSGKTVLQIKRLKSN